MEKGNEVSSDQDCNRVNESSLEDDTEDYIQPSQPLSFQSSSLESGSRKINSEAESVGMSISAIDETLPYPNSLMSTPAGDTSNDFIPQSEIVPKRKGECAGLSSDDPCRKRLNLDESSIIKGTPDMFSTQSQLNDTVDVAQLKVPESPSVAGSQNVSLVPESPMCVNETLESENSDNIFAESKFHVLDETAGDLNTSAELDSSNNRKPDKDEERTCDTTGGPREILIDQSQGILDSSGVSSLIHTDNLTSDKKTESQEAPLDDTIDIDYIEYCYSSSSEKMSEEAAGTEKVVPEGLTSVDQDSKSTPVDAKLEQKGLRFKAVMNEELARLQKHSTPENPLSKSLKINESTSSIENGTPPVQEEVMKSSEINFTVYLQVNCQIVMDLIKNEPILKKILNVKELVKKQPKPVFLEPYSDSSYKTKRLSSSSYGSVYSDKTGLPYALPDRASPESLATEHSSSSSVDLDKHIQIMSRQVWQNEYMLVLSLDELIPRYVEQHKKDMEGDGGNPVVKRKSSFRLKKKSHWSHPLDNVLESSMTEQSSGNNSDVPLRSIHKSEASKLTVVPPEDKRSPPKNVEENKVEEKEPEKEIVQKENTPPKNEEVEGSGDSLTEGLLVFARWTDKRYYPGKLKCKEKYDRWEVEFDDSTEKVIREDLILPLTWLTKGELVFALVADKYLSGKIADIIRGEEINFKIELDDTNEEINVKKSDICLNDVMAGIIREKFKPTTKPIIPLKSSAIDFDNVVVGKRVREQRTPIRTTSTIQPGSSTAKKRRVPRAGEEASVEKKTPRAKQTPLPKRDVSEKASTKKKAAKSEEPPQNAESQAVNTGEVTPAPSETKNDGKSGLKRSRASEKPSASNKKPKQSGTSHDSESPTPVSQRKPKSSVKSLVPRFENEASNSEKQDGVGEAVNNANAPSKVTRGQRAKPGQTKAPAVRPIRRQKKGKIP
ncbi:UNVERIFIED_CONTAM: hypothetical protein PYX00_003834 [Menopon gallinae]|uniref:Uncharacterized protein n=1 Tax=Menopon gallinae TaxID=328185 RepID=A0AAW2I1V0_9NEOP